MKWQKILYLNRAGPGAAFSISRLANGCGNLSFPLVSALTAPSPGQSRITSVCGLSTDGAGERIQVLRDWTKIVTTMLCNGYTFPQQKQTHHRQRLSVVVAYPIWILFTSSLFSSQSPDSMRFYCQSHSQWFQVQDWFGFWTGILIRAWQYFHKRRHSHWWHSSMLFYMLIRTGYVKVW